MFDIWISLLSVTEGMDWGPQTYVVCFCTHTWNWIVIDKASGEVRPTYQFTQGNIQCNPQSFSMRENQYFQLESWTEGLITAQGKEEMNREVYLCFE